MDNKGVAASPPGSCLRSSQQAVSPADAAAIPNAEQLDLIEDFCRAVLAGNMPRADEPYRTIAKYLTAARMAGYQDGVRSCA